jgi:endogenous inhibitor of DNA gyrase (YacG/DUF329 family)
MPMLGTTRECQNCFDTYDKSKSTASADTIHLFCSAECEKTDAEWLAAGNEIVKNAEAENPGIFFKREESAQSVLNKHNTSIDEHHQDINKLLNLLNIKRPEGK